MTMTMEPNVSSQKIDTAPSEKLMEDCCGCRLRLSRFSTSKGFDEAT